MTDNEIIKALECCGVGDKGCESGCPLNDGCVSPIATMEFIQKEALSLINRQKAEIERSNNYIEELNCKLDMANDSKAQAIKDFAYRLKNIPHSVVYKWQIDEVVKEMVGVDNDER